ncbi:MAG: SpoIIE family protein phosphatase [Turneriella sp.]
MTHLDAEKTQRYRRQLLAAVFARYFWIGLSLALLHYFKLPFRNELTIAGGILGGLNTVALFSFWHLKFDHAMVYCMVTGDNLVLLYAVAATGLFASPFSIVLIVVAALTVLVADLRFGMYSAILSAIGYAVLGSFALMGKLPSELNIPPFNPVFAILQIVVLDAALLTIVGILGFVVSRLQKSEASFFDQGIILAEKNSEMSADMAIAATVQKAILASNEMLDDRIAISGRVKPMLEVGGDYFEIFRFDSGEIGIFVADVSGHGAGSALITAMLKVSLENAARGESDTGRILSRINDDMCRIIGQTDFYLTGILCKVHPDTYAFEYCGAAHPEIYLLSGKSIRALESGGTILGKLPALQFPVNSVELQRSDRLLIYTDGITEARHKNGEFWGENRLTEILTQSTDLNAAQFTERVFNLLDIFHDREKASDDRTLVTLDILSDARLAADAELLGNLVKNVEQGRKALATGNLAKVEEMLAHDNQLPLRARISLVRLLRRQKGTEVAISHLTELLKKFPDHPLLTEEIGRTWFAAGNMREAQRYFALAAQKDKSGYSEYYLAKIQAAQ